jgi:hypothetical protein
MRRWLLLGTAPLLVLALATPAHALPADAARGQAAGWRIEALSLAEVILGPGASASLSSCPTDPPDPCSVEDSAAALNAKAPPGTGEIASADLLLAHAEATRDAEIVPELQPLMDSAAASAGGPAMPAAYNSRGYARTEGFSALDGTILADTLEAETASAAVDEESVLDASAARVVNLRLAGVLALHSLAPIVPDEPNQELLDVAGVRIVFWETNWDAATGTTTDEGPVWVNALRITDETTGSPPTRTPAYM